MESICLNCETGYNSKAAKSKFCSSICRVKYHRKNKGSNKKSVEKSFIIQAQVILNSILDAVEKINSAAPPVFSESSKTHTYNQTANLLSFQDFLNGMANLHFSDEKEDYQEQIKKSNLTDKEIKNLLKSLWANQ